MESEKNKPITVRINPTLKNKVEQYLEISKANGSKLKKTKFFNELLEDFFKDKVLEKGFIELEEEHYVNTSELAKNRVAYAKTEKPSSDLKNQMIIYKVPNNLDSWSNEYKTFCSEEPNSHEGIIPYVALLKTEEGSTVKVIYHVFKLYFYSYDGTSGNTLDVSILSSEEVEIFLNQYPEEVAEELLEEFKAIENAVAEDIDSGLEPIVIFKKYDNPSIFRMLLANQDVTKTTNLFNSMMENMFTTIATAKKDFDNISKDYNKEIKEVGRENITEESIEAYEDRIVEADLNLAENLLNFNSNLSGRDSKTLEELSKGLEENPDNPVYNMLDSIVGVLTEAISSEESVPMEEVVEDVNTVMAEELFKLKENPDYNLDYVERLFDSSDLNPELLKFKESFLKAESKEEYIEQNTELLNSILQQEKLN